MPFNKNVFINCPFDKAYKRLLYPIIFTCQYCGLQPRLSKLEDSGKVRIDQIIGLIKDSKYSIHDLSRMKAKRVNELARFNMPFELGLDLGIKESGNRQMRNKKSIVIDSERYRYQAAISDLGGSDIASYGKKYQVESVISILRDWFTHVIDPVQPSGSKLYLEYTEFIADLELKLVNLQFNKSDIKKLTNTEYIHYAGEWISNRP